MNEENVVVYLTDKNGCEMFREIISKKFSQSARRNLDRHLMAAKLNPKHYHFLDVETARIEIKELY